MSVFDIKTGHAGGVGAKNGKILSTLLLNDPFPCVDMEVPCIGLDLSGDLLET